MKLKDLGQTAGEALIHLDIRLEREHWTMFRQKLTGIAAAATLGSAAMLGAGPASAAIMLEATDATNSVTYAKETITAEVDKHDGYYMITQNGDSLDVVGKVGTGIAGSTRLLITYKLEGMIFTETSLNADAEVALTIDGVTDSEISYRRSVDAGAKEVAFVVTTDSTIAATAVATLNIENLGVMEGGGTVQLTSTDDLIDESPLDAYTSKMGSVKIENALMPMPSPMNQQAKVRTGYKAFGIMGDPDAIDDMGVVTGTEDDTYTVSMGTFRLGFKPHQLADGMGAVDDVNDLITMGDTTATYGGGDVSFTNTGTPPAEVWIEELDAGSDPATVCTATGNRKLAMDADGDYIAYNLVDDEAGNADGLTADEGHHLCLTANKIARIPRTAPYTVMVDYEGIADAKFPPMDATYNLGRITRNGTVVNLPYLTTHASYNQRIVIVNRGADDAKYYLDFTTEEGVMADGGTGAEGMAGGMETTILSLANPEYDVVTITGMPPRASATLIVESEKGYIDVATTQVNKDTGGTDTVVYGAEEDEEQ
jgi:hypothetical protein